MCLVLKFSKELLLELLITMCGHTLATMLVWMSENGFQASVLSLHCRFQDFHSAPYACVVQAFNPLSCFAALASHHQMGPYVCRYPLFLISVYLVVWHFISISQFKVKNLCCLKRAVCNPKTYTYSVFLYFNRNTFLWFYFVLIYSSKQMRELYLVKLDIKNK